MMKEKGVQKEIGKKNGIVLKLEDQKKIYNMGEKDIL